MRTGKGKMDANKHTDKITQYIQTEYTAIKGYRVSLEMILMA